MGNNPLLQIENLQVFYGGIQAIHGISLQVEQGEIISVIGANGAGKSTLLKTIAGDKEYKAGSIKFEGNDLPSKGYQFVEKGISLVPEGRRIFVNLTVKDNLMVGAYVVKSKESTKQCLEEVYELFPRLKEREKQMGGTLSGGEQQMLAVGRAMMARPKLMMLDEPSLGLAPIIIDEMFEKFREINRVHGTTMIIVEQNAQLALEVSKRAYVMSVGNIILEGDSKELMDDSKVQEAYLGFK